MKIKNILLSSALGLYVATTLVMPAEAAAIYFSNGSNVKLTMGVSQWLSIKLDTQGANINTVGGSVTVPANLYVAEVNSGDSFVDLWIQRPTAAQVIPFSGVKIGGLQGTGELFSIRVAPQKVGSGTINFNGLTVLAHDGNGTPVATASNGINYTIEPAPTPPIQGEVKPKPTTPEGTQTPEIDTTPPEKFVPLLSRSPEIFDGQWFLVFDTTDKGSGIAKYQVREGNGEFKDATSPYLILDQSLNQKLTVRAIDNAGNFRDAQVKIYRGLGAWTGIYWLLGLLLLILLLEIGRMFRDISNSKPLPR